jgi:sigma-B regulation protein RsbU (phosphoserine phosphatase)
MITVEPVEVLGRIWFVTVASDFTEVESVIKPVFKDVIVWAAGLAGLVTLILFSTTYQLIRSRARLERMKHEVIEKEIEDARAIQLHWLPKGKCGCSGIDIAALNLPATHISGDFYDWFELDDGRIVVTIGDVTGHGMAAAFLMATTQLLVRTVMHRVGDPGACLEEVNRQLSSQTFNGQFVTMLILVIDPSQCTLEVATAGHHPPLMGTGDAFAPLEVDPRLVLGVEPDEEFPTQRFELIAGSSLLLFTDGASDVQAPSGERFSNEGLAAALYGRYESADAILQAVRTAVDDFRRGRDLADDLTLVSIQLEPAPVPTREAAVNV